MSEATSQSPCAVGNDQSINADIARATYGVTGAGVKAGVVSDSFALVNNGQNSYAADILAETGDHAIRTGTGANTVRPGSGANQADSRGSDTITACSGADTITGGAGPVDQRGIDGGPVLTLSDNTGVTLPGVADLPRAAFV